MSGQLALQENRFSSALLDWLNGFVRGVGVDFENTYALSILLLLSIFQHVFVYPLYPPFFFIYFISRQNHSARPRP